MLTHANGAVTCLDCGARYGLPAGAEIPDEACPSCGLPTMRVERGRAFTLCIDRECQSLDAAVTAAFDRTWDCPDCDGRIRIVRNGTLLAGCESYPTARLRSRFRPVSSTASATVACQRSKPSRGRRCLDVTCERVG